MNKKVLAGAVTIILGGVATKAIQTIVKKRKEKEVTIENEHRD